jgi:phosphate/sulfate permease
VQLFKSLFCLKGLDTRVRFFAICASSFLLFILFSKALSQSTILPVFITIVLTGLIALSTQRRLRDSALNSNWILAPIISFFIVALIILFSKHTSSYWLLLLPALCLAILLTYPSKVSKNARRVQYILGYDGPVDLTKYQKQITTHKARRRIEPRLKQDFEPFYEEDSILPEANKELLDDELLAREPNTGASFGQAIESVHQKSEQSTHQADIGEMIRLKLLKGKNAKVTIYTGIALVFIAFMFSFIISSFTDEVQPEVVSNSSAQEEKQLNLHSIENLYPLEMPDAFSLYLSPYKGLIISWQADEVNNGTLWSQVDVQGDKSCNNIAFSPRKSNKQNTFRTLNVTVEETTNYYASFSPLDTKELIQSLAFRGKFSLCGYSFSLKGSQSALGKNKHYAEWVDY